MIGRSFDEHLANLQAVLQRFREANLKLKPAKCEVFQHRVKFLGHIVSKEGIKVDPQKLSAFKLGNSPRQFRN